MAKGYWIAHVTVTDPEPYALYAAGTAEAFGKYGGKVLARGGSYHAVEGFDHPRNVVIEFPSLQAAVDCYHSEEYQRVRVHRVDAGIANITLVEGV